MLTTTTPTLVRPVPVRATAPYCPRPSRVALYARFMAPPSAPRSRELESPLVRSMVYNMVPVRTFGVPVAPEVVQLALSPLPIVKRSMMEIAVEQWEKLPGLKRLREEGERAAGPRQGQGMPAIVGAGQVCADCETRVRGADVGEAAGTCEDGKDAYASS